MPLTKTVHRTFSGVSVPLLLGIEGLLRPVKGRVARHYKEGLDFRQATLNWASEQKTDWILRRLRNVVNEAAAHTKYYADLLQSAGFPYNSDFSFEDFARIPVLERSTLINSGEEMISRVVPRADLRPDASGGSSGEPARFWLGPQELGWNLSALRFFLDQLGVPLGSRVAYLWGHHLDPGHRPSVARRLIFWIRNEQWFDCFRLSDEILLRYHQEMERFQPDCVIAYASALGMLADFLQRNGITASYPSTCIITGAEKLFASQRATVEKVFRRPVYERYGARDGGLLGYQLPPDATDFTIDWSNSLVEPETDDPESAILVTKLHADGMPMIRYRIGDIGMFPVASMPGHPVLRLDAVAGRSVDRIWLRQGSYIHGNQFPHMLKDFPIREFMVVQSEDYSVELQVVPTNSFSSADENALLAMVGKNLPGLPVRLVRVDSIARTVAQKWRPVVSRVQR